MNKNKILGFTLIELLAVIVILAIIALIATPIVLDIIDDVKKSSLIRNVENIESAAELYVSKSYLTKENLNNNIYNKVMEMVSGKQPDNGIIYTNSSGEIAFAIEYDKFCYTKGYEDKEIKAEELKDAACLVPIDYIMVQNQDNDASKAAFGGSISKEKVEKIYTVATNKVPSGVIGSFDVSENKNGSVMAWYKDKDGNGLFELYLGQDGGVKANPNSFKLFNYFVNVKEIDLSNYNTENVTDMAAMFQHCHILEIINFNNFNTRNVTTMQNMFYYCNSIENLDLSSFDTSKVSTMRAMFFLCRALTKLDLSNFDTSKVTTMNSMFAGMTNLKMINVSNFNTRKVEDMSYMFGTSNSNGTLSPCQSLETLNLSSFDTSNVTTMQGIFKGTTNLKTLKLNKAMFTKVTEYSGMFTDTAVENITVKDSAAKTFIEARLTDAGKTATVTIG